MHDFDEGICENIIFAIMKLNKIKTEDIEKEIKAIHYRHDRVRISGSHRGKESTFKIKGTAASVIFLSINFEILTNKLLLIIRNMNFSVVSMKYWPNWVII